MQQIGYFISKFKNYTVFITVIKLNIIVNFFNMMVYAF